MVAFQLHQMQFDPNFNRMLAAGIPQGGLEVQPDGTLRPKSPVGRIFNLPDSTDAKMGQPWDVPPDMRSAADFKPPPRYEEHNLYQSAARGGEMGGTWPHSVGVKTFDREVVLTGARSPSPAPTAQDHRETRGAWPPGDVGVMTLDREVETAKPQPPPPAPANQYHATTIPEVTHQEAEISTVEDPALPEFMLNISDDYVDAGPKTDDFELFNLRKGEQYY
jgi:hypothetical protein